MGAGSASRGRNKSGGSTASTFCDVSLWPNDSDVIFP